MQAPVDSKPPPPGDEYEEIREQVSWLCCALKMPKFYLFTGHS